MDDVMPWIAVLFLVPVFIGTVAVICWAPAELGFAAAAGAAMAWCWWDDAHSDV
jgi:hypothetical protein